MSRKSLDTSPASSSSAPAQLVKPALAVNVPDAQSAHMRSLLAVATAVVYLPATQGLLTGAQEAVPPMAENVVPTWQGEHELFAVAEPATKPNPAVHVAQRARPCVVHGDQFTKVRRRRHRGVAALAGIPVRIRRLRRVRRSRPPARSTPGITARPWLPPMS